MNNVPTLRAACIYIVDDDEDLVRTLSRLFTVLGYEVNAYTSVEDFTKQGVPHFEPALNYCLLLDVCLPGMNGISALPILKSSGYDLPIVIMTAKADIPKAVAAMQSGAFHFLEKPFKMQLLLETVGNALATDTNNQSLRQVRRQYQALVATLSVRETEVLQLMFAGNSNKSIADKLTISIQTAAKHSARVLEKMRVRNVADLINLNHKIKTDDRIQYPIAFDSISYSVPEN